MPSLTKFRYSYLAGAAALGVLGLGLWYAAGKPQQPIPQPYLPVEWSRLQTVRMVPPGEPSFRLERGTDGRWRVYTPQRATPFQADTLKVGRLMRKLQAFQPDQWVAAAPSSRAKYQLQADKRRLLVLYWQARHEEDSQRVWIGGTAFRNEQSAITYVSRPGDEAVYALPIYLGRDMLSDPLSYHPRHRKRHPGSPSAAPLR